MKTILSDAAVEVIFDEGVPEPLARQLQGHELSTVRAEGWTGIKNSELLNWPVIRPHVDKIAAAIEVCEPGTVTKIECGTFVPHRFRKATGP